MGLPQLEHGLSPKSVRANSVGAILSGVGVVKQSSGEFGSRFQMSSIFHSGHLFAIAPRFSVHHTKKSVSQPRQLPDPAMERIGDSKALLNRG